MLPHGPVKMTTQSKRGTKKCSEWRQRVLIKLQAGGTQVGAKAQLTDAEEKTTEKGDEFHYRPSNVSLTELVDWVAAEGKCCPFFRFSHRPRTRGPIALLAADGGRKESNRSSGRNFKFRRSKDSGP